MKKLLIKLKERLQAFHTAYEYVGITLGLILTAAAIDIFLVPNKLVAGGVSGIATVLHYTIGVPVGMTMLVFNIILLIIGTRVFGKSYSIKTIYGAVGVSILVDILYMILPKVTGDPMLSAVYGGILSGIGMGIVFKYKGNTGGTDIVAQIIQKFSNIPVGKAFLIVDGLIILMAAAVFGLKLALYGMLVIIVMGWVIDLVQEGLASGKIVYIISEKNQEIAADILHVLDRGATFLSSIGAYTGIKRNMIMVVVERKELEETLEIVRKHDPKAFVIVHDAKEVIGHGFKPWHRR